VLEEGPHAERERYDPKKALAAKLGDLSIEQVGKDQKLPWELDGERWHTQDRITTKGTPIKWEGEALATAVRTIEGHGFTTNWNHRSVIEIVGPKKADGWFVHAYTGHEAYLTLAFQVKKNTFKQADLAAKLKLRPLSDYPGHEGYARNHRVEVHNTRGLWQQVVITLVKADEAKLPVIQEFIQQAAEAHKQVVDSLKTGGVEAAMPWKKDGEGWHLGEKGFPPGKPVKWDRGLLPKFLDLLKQVEPKLEVKWDLRDAIGIRMPGISRLWVRIKTKERDALEAWLMSKPAQFNVARFEGVGREAKVEGDRQEGCDVVTLKFVTADNLDAKKLLPLLKEQARGFREIRGE
jgi:excinuclease ABC subunit A